MSDKFDLYADAVPILMKGIEKSENHQIIDLASGGGGPWNRLAPRLKVAFPDLRIRLTDYHLNEHALDKVKSLDP